MKCFNHPDRDAVGTCVKCGKSLCKECAEKYSPCLCDDCYNALRQKEIDDLKSARKQLLKTFLISLGLALIVYLVAGSGNGAGLWAMIAFFAPYGWNYSNLLGLRFFYTINPQGCLLMIVVYFFRAIVSTIIGVFCFIAALFRYFKLLRAEKTAAIEDIQ